MLKRSFLQAERWESLGKPLIQDETDGLSRAKRPRTLPDTRIIQRSSEVPPVQKALIIDSFENEMTLREDVDVPLELDDYDILVKNSYVGLNHFDWKTKKYKFCIYSFPWINGRESSGVVVKLGKKVSTKDFPLNCKVFLASTSYRNIQTSTFQEYTVFDSRLVWKVPSTVPVLDVEERTKYSPGFDLSAFAGTGVSLVTAGCSLSYFLDFDNLTSLNGNKKCLVIWGGSTSIGHFLIQLAKYSNAFEKIIAVAGLQSTAHLKTLGADEVIDRFETEDNIIEKLLETCSNKVEYAIDLASKDSAKILMKVMQKSVQASEKKIVCVSGTPSDEDSYDGIAVETINIKKFHENIEFGKSFVRYTSELFGEKKLKLQRNIKLIDDKDSFDDRIKRGLKDLEEQKYKGTKIVVKI
ncbi:LAFE_0E05116g1_1 [Lachancea fermentati]|uniref:LAFE_0E05116g1_1 n=1 Tax=Lachancea fermentati TaxID=4955 RepID=A0A1G4MCV5_LACFM|nr:LAFE_0E05116g1_1 [Lachancea fermentati]